MYTFFNEYNKGFVVGYWQVGTCFVGQYYHVLQQQPEYVHQFYTDRSIMHRLDRDKQETATGMMVLISFSSTDTLD
jgi:hypothetical protein